MRLTVDLQGGGASLFLVAVAVVALVAEAGEGLGAEAAAAHGVTQFGEGLLAVGVVIAFRSVAETIEGDGPFAFTLMAAVRRAQTQGNRAVVMQCVNTGMPALDVAIDAGRVELGFRIAAEHAQTPCRIQCPVSTEHTALGALFETAAAVFAIELAVAADALQPEATARIRVVQVARFRGHAIGCQHGRLALIETDQQTRTAAHLLHGRERAACPTEQ